MEETEYKKSKRLTKTRGIPVSIQDMQRLVKILEESKDKHAPKLKKAFEHFIYYYSI